MELIVSAAPVKIVGLQLGLLQIFAYSIDAIHVISLLLAAVMFAAEHL